MLKIMAMNYSYARSTVVKLVVDSVGVGVVITLCFLFEFVMVQTPNRMRGIMMGLHGSNYMHGASGIEPLIKLFHQLQAATPSCVFYYYLVLSLLVLLILVVYVILVKCYKLREKDRQSTTL